MTHRVALVTDSTSDLPVEWVQQYEISVVPLTIVFGEQAYLDGVEMTAAQFYQRLAVEAAHPTTSQPSPQRFAEAYQRAQAAGAEEIVTLTISSAMSGTIESARQAASAVNIPVHLWDSKNNSMGLGWQVMAAARAREAGGSAADMLAAAEAVRSKMVYYISLDTIDFLSRGGRMAEAARFLNSILRIKPLIYVNPQSGTVGAAMPSRSRKAAIEALYGQFCQKIGSASEGGGLHITVLHNNAQEEAEALAARVQADHQPQELFISIVSPALGVHTGPGALALCGYRG